MKRALTTGITIRTAKASTRDFFGSDLPHT
jgi:hypothetical protein